MTKTLAFTGHRPNKIKGWDWDNPWTNPGTTKLVSLLTAMIDAEIANGFTEFISGGALGLDQIAFWCVHKLKVEEGRQVKNILAIPYQNQPNKWSNQGGMLNWYEKMLRCADEVYYVDNIAGYDRDKKVPIGAHSNSKLQIRNEFMVDHANKLIAFWDGSRGGTYNCIQYAQKARDKLEELPILQLYPREWR